MRAGQDAAAVAVDVGADRAAVETEHRLVRQDQRHRIVVGRTAARGAGLLAKAAHHQIGADRHARSGTRAERGRARRVVRIGGIAGPTAALIAEYRRQHLLRAVPAAGIAGATVVFRVHRLGEDDRALVAQLLDQHVVACREIDVVARIAAGRGAHVLGVERILEREHDAVHRHSVEIGILPVERIEFGCALQRVRQTAEFIADRRRARRQRSLRRVTIELATAGHGPFAADVERGQRVQLPAIRNAGDHAVLLLHAGIRGGRLHPAEFERRSAVLVEVRQDGRGPDGRGRENAAAPSRAPCLWPLRSPRHLR